MLDAILFLLLQNSGTLQPDSPDQKTALPSFSYNVAQTHELQPHRRHIPLEGMHRGLTQFRLTLTVSDAGDVLSAEAVSDPNTLKFWPIVREEVMGWKFTPFEKEGQKVAAEVEEYLDLLPPERFPTTHVSAPVVRPDSKVTITLQRSGCYGACPAYTVSVATDGIAAFDGLSFVVATGKHTSTVDPAAVTQLGRRFVDADFYSMDDHYSSNVTDCPTYDLAVDIDGRHKAVHDYMGTWEGMPAVITELENEVDSLAQTPRWIGGAQGLVQSLKAEKLDFATFRAQSILKAAAENGQAESVRDLLAAGVPLKPLPNPNPKDQRPWPPPKGWLESGAKNPETLRVLIGAGASRSDQHDKDLALDSAATSGSLESVQMLISYGGNPKAIFKDTDRGYSMDAEEAGASRHWAGSVLISATHSGNPDVVREILVHRPPLEALSYDGKTAIFAVGDAPVTVEDGALAECVRLLAGAGANVNAKDKDGNTPLHELVEIDVLEELFKFGADVNARNKNGETPIFTNFSDDAVSLFVHHGADVNIRNNAGKTASELSAEKDPKRQEALRRALEQRGP